VPPDSNGSGRAAVGRRNAMELEIRVPAPRRSVQQFGLLKGTINVVGPTKMLTFRFDKLSKIEKRAEVRKAEQEGVNVLIRKFLMEGPKGDALWTAELQLDYPPDGPKFESFQSWIVNNEIYLEKGKEGSGERFPSNGGYNTDDIRDNTAIVQYRFTDEPDKKLVLGEPAEYRLVYKTPGKIVEVPVTFEFKGLALP
jgi:hypothetical protein